MKKTLLFVFLMVSAVATAWAVTDGVTYEPVNGINIVNLWIQDRAHTQDLWANQPYCSTNARTAVMSDGYIYITRTNANTIIQGTDTLLQSVVYKLDAANGNMIKELPLTLDGAIYGTTTLNANNIGVDNFGHLYIAPYSSELATESPIYLLDGETGALTLVASLEKGDMLARCDYMDVMGDLTREQAECNIMTVSGSTADPGFPTLYRMHADQGGDWEGGFDGDPYMDIINFYPETKTGFSLDDTDAISAIIVNPPQGVAVRGLMAMASHTDDESRISADFRTVATLFRQLFPNGGILSMGMSDDYQLAIAEGANMVRIGSRLFEDV